MAQYVNQYVTSLLNAERSTAVKNGLGIDIMWVDSSLYRINLMTLTLVGVVMKKISEVAPSVTDAVWQDALAHALDQGATPDLQWPAWVLNQIDPNAIPPEGVH